MNIFFPCTGGGRNHSQKGLMYSDIHEFATYSDFNNDRPKVLEAIKGKDFVVEAGDISECKNIVGVTVEEVVKKRLTNLDEQIRINPTCQIHILLGNHERYNKFVDPLMEYAKSHPQVHIHESYVRIGDAMYIHGDWHADDKDDILNRPYKDQDIDGIFRAKVYKGVLGIGAAGHIAERFIYPKEIILPRIRERLMKECPEDMKGVKHIFFGHVHYTMDGVEHEGIKHHNAGASIRFRNLFNMMEFEVSPSGETENIRSIATQKGRDVR